MRAYRHGDVVIRELSDREYTQVCAQARTDRDWNSSEKLTLAEGEITGHSHQLVAGEGALIEYRESIDFGWGARTHLSGILPRDSDYKVLSLPEEMSLTHEEHAEIKLPKGNYVVYQQRETWSGGRPRRVYD